MALNMGETDVIIGTIVGFVVVLDEGFDNEKRVVFQNARSALDHLQSDYEVGKSYYKQIQHPEGELMLDPGIGKELALNTPMYGISCSGCGQLIWWYTANCVGSQCEECAEADPSRQLPGYGDQPDRYDEEW
jgi:hypothetical protein